MKTVTRTLGLVTVAIGTAACPQADRVDVVRIDTLSTGAVVVSNPATGVWQPGEAWELTVVREIRGQTSFWFDRIWALALDSVGRTYAADRSSTVRVFTPHGALHRTIGRPGGGPGEFRWITGLEVDAAQRLWVIDYGNARISVFDSAGVLAAEFARSRSRYYVPWRGRLGADGTIYDFDLTSASAVPSHAPVRLDSTLRVEAVAELPKYVARSVPFAPEQLWRVDSQGSVWFGVTAVYRLHKMRFDGDTLLTVHIDIPAPSIPAAERRSAYRAWRERLGFTAAATDQAMAQPELSAIPDTRPLFEDFWIDELGNLWVVPQTSDGQLAQEFDIIDASGRYLGKVSTPVPLDVSTNPIFAKGGLIGVARDSLDVEYIVSIAIGRSR